MDNTENKDEYVKLKYFGLGKIIPYIARHKAVFFLIIIGSAVASALNAISPLFLSYAIDNFVGKGNLDKLLPFVIAFVGCNLLSAFGSYLTDYNAWKLEMCLLRDLRRTAFNHVQTLSVSFFNKYSVGKIHSRVMSDTGSIGSVIAWNTCGGLYNLVYVVTALVIMFSINPLLSLCVIGVMPLVVLISLYFNSKLVKLHKEVREINSEVTGGFNEGITGVQTTKTLAVEKKLDSAFYEKTERYKSKSLQLGLNSALLQSLMIAISIFAIAAVLWYGGKITQEGVILIGTLSVFIMYAQGIMDPLLWFVNVFVELVSVKVNLERFTTLVESKGDVTDTKEVIEKYGDAFNLKTENWEKLEGDIEFDDVTFKYPDGEEYILEHFNLKVKKGTTVAIVGETGAGKSTLVNLVCRFFEPTEGRVLIDGKDARERSIGWLHANLGYVLQTPHLFSGTVRENLLYGKEDATQEEMDKAVKSVNADGIIARLEKGYDTEIGEGGNSLSVGEKQLLSFARAILANPAIFILDEATSSVDTITEKAIQEAIETLMKGRTSFVIAHRLSTIRSADIILVVSEGKIVERGTHEQLLKQHGVYYKQYLQQFREEQLKNL